MRKHLFDLLFVRLELVSVGDEQLGAQERRDVEDFHLLGLKHEWKRIWLAKRTSVYARCTETYPGFELGERDLDTGGFLTSLDHDELNLFLDELTEQKRQQLGVIGGLVHVFSEAL